jgi:hypothetical protein
MNAGENGQKYGAHFVAPKPLLIKGIIATHLPWARASRTVLKRKS